MSRGNLREFPRGSNTDFDNVFIDLSRKLSWQINRRSNKRTRIKIATSVSWSKASPLRHQVNKQDSNVKLLSGMSWDISYFIAARISRADQFYYLTQKSLNAPFIDNEICVCCTRSEITNGGRNFLSIVFLQSAIVFRLGRRRKCVIGKLPRNGNFENII